MSTPDPARRPRLTTARATAILLVAVGALVPTAGAAAADTAQVTRSAWQMHIDPAPHGAVSNGGGFGHGDPRYYVDARVPAADAGSWRAAPDGDVIGFDGRVAGFGGGEASRLRGFACLRAVDYTYFQTFVNVPAGGSVDQFQVAFNGIDDGARISVYNAQYPDGLVVDGSYVFLNGSGTTNLAEFMRVGVNRVVVTQLDDCAVGNNLREARVVLNGTVVPPAPADSTPPVVTANVSPAAPDGTNGWYTGSPTVAFTTEDGESAITARSGCEPATVSTDTVGRTFTCTATSGGGTSSASATVKRDATPAVISGADVADTTWRNTPLTASYTASDATSGLAEAADSRFDLTASAESRDARTPTTVSRTVADNAGNTATRTLSALVDLTAPSVDFAGAAADGATVWTTQAAPTCVAEDVLSGVASCVITGSTSTPGTQTLTATATDKAGNSRSVARTYTVRDMSSTGFYQPVDMGGVVNVVKGGSTVPLKFNVLIDGTQQSATSVVTRFSTAKVACASGAASDEVELVTTGGTALRYDTSGAQFVQNWKTPTSPGECHRATVTLADGETISALFKIK